MFAENHPPSENAANDNAVASKDNAVASGSDGRTSTLFIGRRNFLIGLLLLIAAIAGTLGLVGKNYFHTFQEYGRKLHEIKLIKDLKDCMTRIKSLELEAKFNRWRLGVKDGPENKRSCSPIYHAYNFENVILRTFIHKLYWEYIEQWSRTDDKDKTNFWEGKNINWFGKSDRLELFMNHFAKMKKMGANPIIFSTVSRKDFIQSVLRLTEGWTEKLDVFVADGSSRLIKVKAIIEKLMRENYYLEWYEVIFFDNDDLVLDPIFVNSKKLDPTERDLEKALTQIEEDALKRTTCLSS